MLVGKVELDKPERKSAVRITSYINQRRGAELMMESAEIRSSRVFSPLSSAGHWLWEELWRIIPIAVFFLIGFLLVLLIIKLTLAQYSIEVTTVSRAVIGALIAAKVVLILNHTRLARALKDYPRILPVLWRTLFYGVCFVFLALAERALDQRREHGGFAASFHYVVTHTDLHRLMALSVGVALVFCVYFILFEIADYLGPGVLISLFFKSHPQAREVRS
jgi:hypothetical protein